ncbi:olfactory receptor 52E8-like [Colossoma macropomum]|uniref:olfactory receptor 52E8-like n=1 Tax=Colossoma macropomum TaxID=42526 RepID=UPI0018653BB5|nr:olfactory receptor 52E8-like [Colossoma macropomum]
MNTTRRGQADCASFSMLSLNGTQPPSPLPSDVAVCQFGSIFNNEALMYVSGFFTVTLAIVISLLTVFFMVLERFVYICCGINYLVIMTNVRIYTCLSLIWLLALAVAITHIVIMMLGGPRFGHSIPGLVCEPGVMRVQMAFSLHFEMFDKVTMGTLLFLGLLVFSFSYSRMYQAARQALQPFRQDNKRAQCTVAFYLGVFLLQLFPCAFKFVTMYHEEAHYHLVYVLLLLVPPCVNPLAYGFRNMEVRRALQRLCGFRMTVRRPETDDNLHGLSLALKAPQTSPV